MKLRILNNTLRLRLTKGEASRLGETGKVMAFTQFGPKPNQRLVYALESSDDSLDVTVSYAEGSITVVLPTSLAKQWVQGDQVGLEAEQLLGTHGALKILVEKEFTCLTKQGSEEDVDTFPHPQEGTHCS